MKAWRKCSELEIPASCFSLSAKAVLTPLPEKSPVAGALLTLEAYRSLNPRVSHEARDAIGAW